MKKNIPIRKNVWFAFGILILSIVLLGAGALLVPAEAKIFVGGIMTVISTLTIIAKYLAESKDEVQ